jgi:formylglycine-generating enzyme required for sulfatase activity
MADVLKRVGFAVTLLADADQQQMETAVEALSQQLRRGGVGLFYFAGHGVQVAGQNDLMPVRTSITAEEDVKYKAIGVPPPPTPSEPSKTLRNSLGMEFVLIPAGEFLMGSAINTPWKTPPGVTAPSAKP